jgi:hypothetical protein
MTRTLSREVPIEPAHTALGKSEAPLNDLALRYATPRLAIALDLAAAVSCFSGMLGPVASCARSRTPRSLECRQAIGGWYSLLTCFAIGMALAMSSHVYSGTVL